MRRVFITDCEGPISKNDNAFEITAHYIPNGDKLFTVVSSYDDVLAAVVNKPAHKAGTTLKLILPFLKAYDVTNEKMHEFSAKNLILNPGAREMLNYVGSIAPAFIVSTSYEHYISALCHATSFPPENTYSTKVNLDSFSITNKERNNLKQLAKEIASNPMMEIPYGTKSLAELTPETRETISRLDEIFWKEIAHTDFGKIYSQVNPIGGREKAAAAKDIVRELGSSLTDIMYVGDSITDKEALKLVKESGGLATSFNGNEHAIENAEIAILSENSIVTAVIADVFLRRGKEETLTLVEDWSREALDKSHVDRTVLKHLLVSCPKALPKVKIISSQNRRALAKESTEFRRTTRGEMIGRLG